MFHDKSHITVISHRRSGTHLTIDAIRNNFPIYAERDFLTLEQLISGGEKHLPIEAFKEKLSKGPTLLKTHFLPDYACYFAEEMNFYNFSKELFENSKLIYIYRDGRDVMVSLYHYLQFYHLPTKKMNFKTFLHSKNHFDPNPYHLMNRVSFWNHHLTAWKATSLPMLFLSFEEIATNYEGTLEKIAAHIGQSLPQKIKDVRLNGKNKLQRGFSKAWATVSRQKITRSSVLFNGGKMNQYPEYFDGKDLLFYNKLAGETTQDLGYSLT